MGAWNVGEDSTPKCGLGAGALAAHRWWIRLGRGILAIVLAPR